MQVQNCGKRPDAHSGIMVLNWANQHTVAGPHEPALPCVAYEPKISTAPAMKNMAKVLFIVRKTRSNTGRYLLYCRVTSNGITREISTGEQIKDPQLWDQVLQRYQKAGTEGEFINSLTDKLRWDIKQQYLLLKESGAVHPDKIIDHFRGDRKPAGSVEQIVTDYIESIRKKRNMQTVAIYKKYLSNWMAWPKRVEMAADFSLGVAEQFKTWLALHRGCRKLTRRSRYVQFFRVAFEFARNRLPINPLHEYQAERDPQKEVVFLEPHELMELEAQQFKSKRLRKARDLFIYQCSTGVSYGNIRCPLVLTEVPDIGKIWKGRRIKGTKPWFYVPWSEKAEALLQQYHGTMPRMDKSTYNKSLKIIARMLGISKQVSSHTGRKTFAMMMRQVEGYTTEAVKDMLGHKSVRTTETYYFGQSPQRVLVEMAQLRNGR